MDRKIDEEYFEANKSEVHNIQFLVNLKYHHEKELVRINALIDLARNLGMTIPEATEDDKPKPLPF